MTKLTCAGEQVHCSSVNARGAAICGPPDNYILRVQIITKRSISVGEMYLKISVKNGRELIVCDSGLA